jgi:hypothetical protein
MWMCCLQETLPQLVAAAAHQVIVAACIQVQLLDSNNLIMGL